MHKHFSGNVCVILLTFQWAKPAAWPTWSHGEREKIPLCDGVGGGKECVGFVFLFCFVLQSNTLVYCCELDCSPPKSIH